MSTEKQIQANKANAQKSTGPSPESKPITSRNAVKHGLFSKQRQVPEEDRSLIRQLEQQLYAEYRPQGPTEAGCIDSLVDNIWRLSMTLKIEKDLFEFYRIYDNKIGRASCRERV